MPPVHEVGDEPVHATTHEVHDDTKVSDAHDEEAEHEQGAHDLFPIEVALDRCAVRNEGLLFHDLFLSNEFLDRQDTYLQPSL